MDVIHEPCHSLFATLLVALFRLLPAFSPERDAVLCALSE